MTDYPAHPQLEVDPAALNVTFRPADTRVIKAITGRSPAMLQQSDDADEADREQVVAFMALRQEYPEEAAKVLWDLAEECDVRIRTSPVDPTPGGITMGSPHSADFGG